MTRSSVGTHQEAGFADVYNDCDDEDFKTFLGLQMDCCLADMDASHKIFLEHLREDGNSYILEMADVDNGLPAFVKYEGEDESLEDIDTNPQRDYQNTSYKREGNCKCASESSDGNMTPSSQETTETGSYLNTDYRLKTPSTLDESYQKFLKHIRFDDSSMILDWGSKTIIYEEYSGFLNSSEGLTTEDALFNDGQGLLSYVSELDDDPILTSSQSDSSKFKEKLTSILSQPFDKNEYDRLLQQANERKRLKKQKHLRSMSKAYDTDTMGMSYLDHHPDLKNQLESADQYKGLELLRGFFFWLKNVCHEGSFMPWAPVTSSGTLLTRGYEVVSPLDEDDI